MILIAENQCGYRVQGIAQIVMCMWNYPAYADGLEPLDSYIEEKKGKIINLISMIHCGITIHWMIQLMVFR